MHIFLQLVISELKDISPKRIAKLVYPVLGAALSINLIVGSYLFLFTSGISLFFCIESTYHRNIRTINHRNFLYFNRSLKSILIIHFLYRVFESVLLRLIPVLLLFSITVFFLREYLGEKESLHEILSFGLLSIMAAYFFFLLTSLPISILSQVEKGNMKLLELLSLPFFLSILISQTRSFKVFSDMPEVFTYASVVYICLYLSVSTYALIRWQKLDYKII